MKIFIVLPHLEISGGIKTAIQYCHILNENGYDCITVAPSNTGNKFPSYNLAKFSTWDFCLKTVDPTDIFIFYWPPDLSTFLHLHNRFIFAGKGCFMHNLPNNGVVVSDRMELFTLGPHSHSFFLYAYNKKSKIVNDWINTDIFFPDPSKTIKNKVGLIDYRDGYTQKLIDLISKTKFTPCLLRGSEIEMGEHYRSCDYFVSFARGVFNGFDHTEGNRLPGAEALACGCLVVSVNSWGPLDYFQDRVNCRIAWKNTEEDVVEKLIELDNTDIKEKIRANGIFTIQQRYNKQVVTQQLLEVIGGK